MTATSQPRRAHDDATGPHANHEPSDGDSRNRVSLRPLATALAITLVTMVAEAVGGWLSGSLALIADAAHMATDAAALALAIGATWLARKAASDTYSFGYLRAEILAALVNAVALVVIALFIFREAWERWNERPEIATTLMLVVGAVGLAANAVSARVLASGDAEHNLNTRGAMLHVLGDLAGSVAAVLAALVIMATGWVRADPLLSALIGVLVLWSSFRLLRESVDVLLEATPPGVDPTAVRRAMLAVPGVEGVHDLHVWSVTSGVVALSAHVETARLRDWHAMLDQLTVGLRDQFGIAHVTLQPEDAHAPGGGECSLDTAAGRAACAATLRSPGKPAGHGHRHASQTAHAPD